jgi:tRNA (uracil-5-)-methyltransferase
MDPAYPERLDDKRRRLQDLFAAWAPPPLELFPSPPDHYRQRAEFRVWHEGGDSYYVMFEPGARRPYRVDHLPIASRRINELMAALRARWRESPLLRERLYQVEFLTTLAGDALITLIYHRRLDEHWTAAARALEGQLDCAVIGRSRGQRLVLSRDYVTERLDVAGRTLRYRQPEGGFTQPNATINAAMLGWARDCCDGMGGRDLLELYCGNGNFTVALAGRFRRVLATEMAKVSVQAARHNLADNGMDNVDIVRLRSDEVSAALRGVRPFRRLRDVDLAALDFACVLVDPPRAGLDPATLDLVARCERILYISCNPQSMRDNLTGLDGRWRIRRFALFDQFPFTPHIEAGLLLSREENPA